MVSSMNNFLCNYLIVPSFLVVVLYCCMHFKLATISLRISPFEIFEEIIPPKGYIGAIKKHAKHVSWGDSESMKFIILAMADKSFADMALNLYLSSFKRFDVRNFLFVGGGRDACERLNKLQIQCFEFVTNPSTNESSPWGTKEFIQKMNIRTEMILPALHAGFSVLHTDLDVVFLKDPMPELEDLLKNNDMAILWDYSVYNAGFLAIKASPFAIDVYTKIQTRTNATGIDDQEALNGILNEMNKNHSSNASYKAPAILDRKKYLCGRDYFSSTRNFPSPNLTDHCPECVVVHNNWIVSKEAKVFRFQESGMWYVDEDGYYSDTRRRYLFYYNPRLKDLPRDLPFDVKSVEIKALRTAFKTAHVLNRTLILPRFNCDKNFKCPLNSWFTMTHFHKQFYPGYRESSFLLNQLVSESISMRPVKGCLDGKEPSPKSRVNSPTDCNKQDAFPKSKCIPFNPLPILIVTNSTIHLLNSTLKVFPNSKILNFSAFYHLNETQLLEAFGQCSDQVLVLTSLLGIEVKFSDPKTEQSFEKKLNAGFVPGVYAQIRF